VDLWISKIERRGPDVRHLTGSEQCGVAGNKAVSMDAEKMIHLAIYRALTAEIPVSVVRQVDHGWSIGCGSVKNAERIAVFDCIGCGHCQRSGITLVAIWADILQCHRSLILLRHFPVDLVEPSCSAMKRVGAIIGGNYQISRRRTVEASFTDADGREFCETGLNGAVVSRGAISRMIRLNGSIKSAFVNCYSGDGLIVATPTGSSGASRFAGGPISTPEDGVSAAVVLPLFRAVASGLWVGPATLPEVGLTLVTRGNVVP